ncbi:MAG: hypothetical protein WKF66_16560 [Pedobacter sp.]
MKPLKIILIVIIGALVTISIYRGLTIDKLEKLDSLLIVAYSSLILLVSFMETIAKRHKDTTSKD